MSGGIELFPSAGHFQVAANASLATPSSANTPGAWTALFTTGEDVSALDVVLHPPSQKTRSYSVDLQISGAAGTFTLVSGLMVEMSVGTAAALPVTYRLPLAIPSGYTVSGRFSASILTGATMSVDIVAWETNLLGTPAAAIDTIGFNSTTTLGTPVLSGVSGAFGAYSQLIGATSYDYLGLLIAFDAQNASTGFTAGTQYQINLAIGASGSEVVIVPGIPLQTVSGATVGLVPRSWPLIPVRIPAGSRIAAAVSSSAASADILGLTLYGVR